MSISADNFQLGPDKRIYGIQRSTRNLFVITDPDNGGTDVRTFANYLTNTSGIGLPTFAASFFIGEAVEKSFVCRGNDFRYMMTVSFTDPVSDYPVRLVWNWGDGSALEPQNIVAGQTTYKLPHNYTNPGKYTITITPYKAGNVALSPVTVPVNVIDCKLKVNRQIRINLPNTAEKNINQ